MRPHNDDALETLGWLATWAVVSAILLFTAWPYL